MPASYTVHIDWDANGNFTGTYDNVTGRVLDGRTQVTCSYGRDTNRSLAPAKVGEAGFELDNSDRLLSPENTASALFDKAVPGREVRIQATLAGTTYTPFRGHIDDLGFNLEPEEQSIDVTCLDSMSRLKGVEITTGMYRGLRTGDALHVILDRVGWPAELRDIDPGATVIPYWWLESADAYDAAMALVDSEGPSALLTADDAGKVVFRDRHHRLWRTASQTVQATWRSGGAVEPCFSAPATYGNGRKEIINSVSFDVSTLVAGPLDVIWSAPSSITLTSGQTLAVTVKGSTPFIGAITPANNVDYTVTGTVTISMSRPDGESTTLLLTAPSGAATVNNLQVRGYPLVSVPTVVTVEDGASISKYGLRSGSGLRRPVWAGVHDAAAVAMLTVAQRAERLAVISVTMGGNDTRLVQQLSRDLSDRVRVVESHTGLDADCWVNQIAHSITQGGLEHRTTFGLEKVAEQVTGALVLGSATAGILGTNRLGRRGFAAPDKIFTLGSPTNGVLGTDVLAA